MSFSVRRGRAIRNTAAVKHIEATYCIYHAAPSTESYISPISNSAHVPLGVCKESVEHVIFKCASYDSQGQNFCNYQKQGLSPDVFETCRLMVAF